VVKCDGLKYWEVHKNWKLPFQLITKFQILKICFWIRKCVSASSTFYKILLIALLQICRKMRTNQNATAKDRSFWRFLKRCPTSPDCALQTQNSKYWERQDWKNIRHFWETCEFDDVMAEICFSMWTGKSQLMNDVLRDSFDRFLRNLEDFYQIEAGAFKNIVYLRTM
jgi:hypothetical protein